MKSNAVPIVALVVSLVGFGAIVTVQNRTTQQQIADLRAQIAKTPPVPTASSKPSADTELAEVTAYLTQIADRLDTQRLMGLEIGALTRENNRRQSNEKSVVTPEEASAADQLGLSPSRLQQLSDAELLNLFRNKTESVRQQLRRDTTFLNSTIPPQEARHFHLVLVDYWAETTSLLTLAQQRYEAVLQASERGDATGQEIAENQRQELRTQIPHAEAERAQKELEALIQKYPQLPERLKRLRV